MPSQEKKDRVKQLRQWFERTDSLLVLRYKGLKVSEANELRGIIGSLGGEIRVVKNSLTRIAISGTAYSELIPLIDGPVAVVFVAEEPAPLARAIKDFSRGRREFGLLGGMLQGSVISDRQAEALAVLPPRNILLGQLAGAMAAPLSRCAGAFTAILQKTLGLFNALLEKMEAGEGAGAANAAEEDYPSV